MKDVARKNWHEGQVGSPKQAVDSGDREQRKDAGTIAHIAKPINQFLPEGPAILYRVGGNAFLTFIVANHSEGNHHGDKRKTVGIETPSQSKELEAKTGKSGPHHPRKLKLRGVQRNCVCQILSSHKIEGHRLVRGSGERHATSRHK